MSLEVILNKQQTNKNNKDDEGGLIAAELIAKSADTALGVIGGELGCYTDLHLCYSFGLRESFGWSGV